MAALDESSVATVPAHSWGPGVQPYAEGSDAAKDPGSANEGDDKRARAVMDAKQPASRTPFKERNDLQYASARIHWEPYRPARGSVQKAVPGPLLDSVVDEPPLYYSKLVRAQYYAPIYTEQKMEALKVGSAAEADYFTEEEAHAALMREHVLQPMCRERYAAVKEILMGCGAESQGRPEEGLWAEFFDTERDYHMRCWLKHHLF